MQGHGGGARGLAEDHHAIGISAERGDVPLHPLERHRLVVNAKQPAAVVAGARTERVRCQEPEYSGAV